MGTKKVTAKRPPPRPKADPVAVVEAFVAAACTLPTTRVYAGIDSGADGAIGLLCGHAQAVIDIPTLTVKRAGGTKTVFNLPAIVSVFRRFKAVRDRLYVCLEQAQVQVKGKGSNAYTGFRVGVAYGLWPLFLAQKGYSVEEVVPVVWKKAMGLTGKDKEHSRLKALGLWPKAALQQKGDHNRAEALLLAEFLRRRHKGE